MDAVTRLRHGRSQTKQTVGLWIGLVTVHTFTSSVTLKPECVPCGGAGLQAQFSGGLLHEPEWFEPYDQKRFTASSDSRIIGFTGSVAALPLAATAASGQTREYAHDRAVADAYLLEWDLRGRERHHFRERVKEEGPNFWALTTSRATISERVRCVS